MCEQFFSSVRCHSWLQSSAMTFAVPICGPLYYGSNSGADVLLAAGGGR